MKTSEAFKQAKQRLKPLGPTQFICHALAEAAYDRSVTSTDFDWHNIYKTERLGFRTAIKVITARIGSESPLDVWLGVQGIPWSDKTPDQMQAYRHRWLDALIAEFEAKGD
jgi:hypothetical protein